MDMIQQAKPYIPAEDIDEIVETTREILESGMLMQGKYVQQFEEAFASYVGTKYATALNSGTAALQGLYHYHGVKGKDVLVPTNTFLATAYTVMYEGGTPILVDINPETLCIDVDTLKQKLTKDTVGVAMVHMAGLVPEYFDEIKAFCKEHGLWLIEDAAHAHGSTYKGKKAGALADGSAFSFVATKVMTTGGEGGIVTTDNQELADRLKSLRFHGTDSQGGIQDRWGFNWRMIEIQAAIGLTQLRRLDEFVARRMEIGTAYDAAFKDLENVHSIPVPDGELCAYYKYPLILEASLDRATIKQAMIDEFKVKSGTAYWPPCHLQPAFMNEYNSDESTCPVASDVLKRTMSIPMYASMTDEDVERVINAVTHACR